MVGNAKKCISNTREYCVSILISKWNGREYLFSIGYPVLFQVSILISKWNGREFFKCFASGTGGDASFNPNF